MYRSVCSSKMQTLQRPYKGKLFVSFNFLDKTNPCCQPTRILSLEFLENWIPESNACASQTECFRPLWHLKNNASVCSSTQIVGHLQKLVKNLRFFSITVAYWQVCLAPVQMFHIGREVCGEIWSNLEIGTALSDVVTTWATKTGEEGIFSLQEPSGLLPKAFWASCCSSTSVQLALDRFTNICCSHEKGNL